MHIGVLGQEEKNLPHLDQVLLGVGRVNREMNSEKGEQE